MARMVSTSDKLKSVSGMLGTKDLSVWETAFTESLVARGTNPFTDKQLEILTQIYDKHFA